MTAAKRVRLSPDVRREQLLELGVRMLATRSLDELSVDVLAEEAGISRGLLFHYFRNKQEFHRAVVRRAADELIERTEPDTTGEPLEQLMLSLAQYVDYVVANYRAYISLVRGAAAGGDPALLEISEQTRGVLTGRVVDNIGLFGVPDTAPVRLLARGWSAMVEEVVLAWIPEQPVSRDELLHVLTATLPALLTAGASVAAVAIDPGVPKLSG